MIEYNDKEKSVFNEYLINAQLKEIQNMENKSFNAGIDAAIEVVVLHSPLPKQSGVPLQEPFLTIFNKLQELKKDIQ